MLSSSALTVFRLLPSVLIHFLSLRSGSSGCSPSAFHLLSTLLHPLPSLELPVLAASPLLLELDASATLLMLELVVVVVVVVVGVVVVCGCCVFVVCLLCDCCVVVVWLLCGLVVCVFACLLVCLLTCLRVRPFVRSFVTSQCLSTPLQSAFGSLDTLHQSWHRLRSCAMEPSRSSPDCFDPIFPSLSSFRPFLCATRHFRFPKMTSPEHTTSSHMHVNFPSGPLTRRFAVPTDFETFQ